MLLNLDTREHILIVKWYQVLELETSKNVFDHLWVVLSSMQDGWSPLMSASQHGHREVATLLIEQGANLNLQNKVSGV